MLVCCHPVCSIPTQVIFATAWFRSQLKISHIASDIRTVAAVMAIVGLFACFVVLCGCTHMLSYMIWVAPAVAHYKDVGESLKITTAVVSVVFAVVFGVSVLAA